MSQALGIVHVFITANATKQRLAELTRHAMPSVLASTAVLKNITGNLGQAKGVIKLSIGEKPTVGGNLGNREIPASVGGQNRPSKRAFCFHPPGDVRCVCSDVCMTLILIAESVNNITKSVIYMGNRG